MTDIAVTKEEWDRVIEMLNQANKAIESAPKWISVKERLPEDSHSVLVYCPEIKCIFTSWYDDFASEWVHFGGCMPGEVYYPVSHWMPLPEPPEEGGGEDG